MVVEREERLFNLLEKGYYVIGIDIVPAMVKIAKELGRKFDSKIEFKTMNVTDLNFKNENFDGALFSFCGWDQIPKKENRLKALKEIYTVLKYNSHLILTSYLRENYWIKEWLKICILKLLGFKIKEIEYGDVFFKKGGKEEYEEEQFIHFPKFSEVEKQIKEAGFKLILYDKRNNIVKEDEKLDSSNCTFFICKKE